jgi:hypothetical protein
LKQVEEVEGVEAVEAGQTKVDALFDSFNFFNSFNSSRLVNSSQHPYDRSEAKVALYEITSGHAAMAFRSIAALTRRFVGIGLVFVLCSRPLGAQQSPPGQPAPTGAPTASATPQTGAVPAQSSGATDRLPESVFLRLDKNHDKAISDAELTSTDAAPYAAKLKLADVDGNNRITLEELKRLGEVPLYRNPRTAAALLLIVGFAAFCLFLDGLFDPEHRDYFWLSIIGTFVCAALAFLFGRSWFLQEIPFLAYVAAASALVIVIAAVFGATREREEPEAASTGPVVYQVGKPTGTKAVAKPGAPTQPPRKPAPAVRTPRPAPVARPPVPERRPQPPPQATPRPEPPPQATPRPAPPPPRPIPPRPPGSRPPSGPKPPPSKS